MPTCDHNYWYHKYYILYFNIHKLLEILEIRSYVLLFLLRCPFKQILKQCITHRNSFIVHLSHYSLEIHPGKFHGCNSVLFTQVNVSPTFIVIKYAPKYSTIRCRVSIKTHQLPVHLHGLSYIA